jgi:2-keto-4-pentenoate hydratase
MNKVDQTAIQQSAIKLRKAYKSGEFCTPIRDDLSESSLDTAYAVQQINTDYWLEEGRRIVGRKIGLTSVAVQKQLGVDQPDCGVLFANMARLDGQEISLSDVQQPKVEAEIAFVLGHALTQENHTIAEIISAIDYVLPAIVGSRVRNWDISIVDTVADNASCGLFVLGTTPKKLAELDMRLCGMTMFRKGEPVSVGVGAACMGNPLNAIKWLADTMVRIGQPLQAGEIILSGALGPMVQASPGDVIEARISGLGSVRAVFEQENKA